MAVRWYYHKTGGRPGSSPYLSGDGFRELTKWQYENADAPGFSPSDVAEGDLIFCDAWHFDRFVTEFAPNIVVPFSVIRHNGDPNLTEAQMTPWPKNLVHLYSQNSLSVDSRVTALPIGLENKRLHYNGVVRDFEGLRKHSAPTLNRILYAFTVGTNAIVRSPALASLQQYPLADGLERVNSRKYRKIAARYRFIVSPPGNGEDCHRTWEAMYLRAVPIVLRSTLTKRFAELGLPLWLVDSYDELTGLTEADLGSVYQRFEIGFDHEALWMGYWARLIMETSK